MPQNPIYIGANTVEKIANGLNVGHLSTNGGSPQITHNQGGGLQHNAGNQTLGAGAHAGYDPGTVVNNGIHTTTDNGHVDRWAETTNGLTNTTRATQGQMRGIEQQYAPKDQYGMPTAVQGSVRAAQPNERLAGSGRIIDENGDQTRRTMAMSASQVPPAPMPQSQPVAPTQQPGTPITPTSVAQTAQPQTPPSTPVPATPTMQGAQPVSNITSPEGLPLDPSTQMTNGLYNHNWRGEMNTSPVVTLQIQYFPN